VGVSGGIRYATFLYVAVDGRLQTEESRVEVVHDCNEPVRVKVTYAFMDAKLEFDPREEVRARSGAEHKVSIHAVSNRTRCPSQDDFESDSVGLLSIKAKVVAWGAVGDFPGGRGSKKEWGSFWVLFEELGVEV
jgi:hypothetical protein